MSYEKVVSHYKIIFKDEESYLEAKLENLRLYPDIPFIGFIQNEIYSKEKCEVESIEPYPLYYSPSSDQEIPPVNYYTVLDPSDFQFISSSNNISPSPDYITTISANDGTEWECNVNVSYDLEEEESPPDESEDPIDNRFDILDL